MLELAAREVLFSWETESQLAADESVLENINSQMAEIVEAVRYCSETGEVPHIVVPPWLPGRQLLDQLRRSFLARAQTGSHSSKGVLRLLYALEVVQQRIEEDISQRFRSRLAGPDALELLTDVAHDMRSPLSSVLFLVETMRRGDDHLPARTSRCLDLLYGAALGLSTLAENLFDLARGTDLLVEPAPIPFSIDQTMQTVLDIVLPIAEEKGLLVDFQRHGSDWRVGHPLALQRVLLNLVTNALHVTASGGIRLYATDLSGSRMLFEVRDSARVSQAAALESIWSGLKRPTPWRQTPFSPPGLALSICHRLVATMGGVLNRESLKGQGTRFFFELDLPPAPEG
jgi:signal transduction histidine kinase